MVYETSQRVHYPAEDSVRWIVEPKPVRSTRVSATKIIERQIIRAWKKVTGAAHKQPRASFLPHDFVLVTAAARRRSIMHAAARRE
ncbi:hypothetical protein CONPUDRAFT_167127 [Coniophora puteana RWD-64-598 SS2]|uniref:Uncharacterized protein n=1 Tax=Coniophora puteana (strain RWD-64-598) TaxID=741705 RepID=A0A5M3MJI4_CONPW|nr:uncharacterized protein CONPUDRAFT_167127 [Coniophora puteana RWD-64-598 SS2]EIW79372.1 hypothetical protein CONPUDRAFT_167127 [Coniophora puteana RWD-64-598 SS2]